MGNESSRRSGFVAAAADARSAWERLYSRLLTLEFDGYAGPDAEVFPRAMETVVAAYRQTACDGRQPIDIFRQVYEEAIAELDRTQPRRT